MNIVTAGTHLLAVTSWGLFTGAMLTEGCVLVPAWRSLPAAQFFAWYKTNDRRLLAFFSPLTFITALLAVVAAVTSFQAGQPGRWLALLAAVIAFVVVAGFFSTSRMRMPVFPPPTSATKS